MKTRTILKLLILTFICCGQFTCTPLEIILHGDITGIVTDTLSNQPLPEVRVKLYPLDDTTRTSSEGRYLFQNLAPDEYEIEVSKLPYAKAIRSAVVISANTSQIDFALHTIP